VAVAPVPREGQEPALPTAFAEQPEDRGVAGESPGRCLQDASAGLAGETVSLSPGVSLAGMEQGRLARPISAWTSSTRPRGCRL